MTPHRFQEYAQDTAGSESAAAHATSDLENAGIFGRKAQGSDGNDGVARPAARQTTMEMLGLTFGKHAKRGITSWFVVSNTRPRSTHSHSTHIRPGPDRWPPR